VKAKARAVLAGLALLALWPAVHHALVRHADLHPWKLGGWSMYAVPISPPRFELEGLLGTRRLPIDPAALPLELLRDFGRFTRWRLVFGRAVSPEPVARRILEAAPELDGLVVVVRHFVIERETARVRWREDRYLVHRD
jgi:hypothetical protein